MSTDRVACPYCLDEIPSAATACRHCGHEVRTLLAVQKELGTARETIAALELRLAAAGTQRETQNPAPAVPVRPDRSALVALWGYYAVSALIVFVVAMQGIPPGYVAGLVAVALLGVGAAAGAMLTVRDPSTDLGMLFMYGFAQPLFIALPLFFLLPPTQVGEALERLPILALVSATVVLSGGLGAALLFPALRPDGFFGVRGLTTLAQRSEEGISSVQKIVTGIASLITALIALSALLG